MSLGNAVVNSSLNQPLSVVIPLTLTPGLDPSIDLINVSVASEAAHKARGISLPDGLRNAVVNIRPGNTANVWRVQVNSRAAITEPLISFLLTVGYEQGELQKEVTLFLDPVSYNINASSGAAIATGAQTTPLAATPASTAKAAQARPTVKRVSPTDMNGGSYDVQRGDTLSTIAIAANKFDASLNIDEYMQAIFTANPDAFTGSMDNLKAGATLVVDPFLISQLPDNVVEADVIVEQPPVSQEIVDSTASEPVANSSESQLTILPDDTVANVNVDSGLINRAGTPEDADVQAIDQLVQNTVDDLDQKFQSMEAENAELRKSIADSERLLSATEELLGDTQTKFEELQLKITALEAAVPAQAETESPVTWKSMLLNNLPWLLLALSLLALAFALLRRRPPVINYPHPVQASEPQEPIHEIATAVTAPVETSVEEVEAELTEEIAPGSDLAWIQDKPEITGVFEAPDADDLKLEVPPSQAVTEYMHASFPPMSDSSTVEHLQDSEKEAEIYLAYQQYTLAEKTINQLLDDDPRNLRYNMMLMQLLAETGNIVLLEEQKDKTLSLCPKTDYQMQEEIIELYNRGLAKADATTPDEDLPKTEQVAGVAATMTAATQNGTFDDITDFLSGTGLLDATDIHQKLQNADTQQDIESPDAKDVTPTEETAAGETAEWHDDPTDDEIYQPDFDLDEEIKNHDD